MRIQHVLSLSVVAVVAAAGACVPSDPTATESQAQLKGAIFTTTVDGTRVNANIYANKNDVYLDGGPAKPSAAALPDGDYFFQVTDPSGKVLLSEDAIDCREFHVSGGVIVSVEASACSHQTGTDVHRGGITVQLMPYADTPNPGGEYKAWVTPVADYSASKGKHGFIESDSKTDNFKVRCEAKTCDDFSGCGTHDDECGGTLDCGCPEGQQCDEGMCVTPCTPKTCSADFPSQCGSFSDGCNGTLDCMCPTGDSCVEGACVPPRGCTPKTCSADFTGRCGAFADGCGGTLDCMCPTGDTCSTDGLCVPSRGCTPKTCSADFAGQCGAFSDGCGGTLSCGCPSGDSCVNGACVPPTCTPDTCANHPTFSCGFLDDGCGGTVCCGVCPSGQSCTTDHVCASVR